jgi:hypothetical protein
MNREHAPHYGLFVLEMAALCTELSRHAGLQVDASWRQSLKDSAAVLVALQDEKGNLLCFGDNDGSGILSSCLSPNRQVDAVVKLAGFCRTDPLSRPHVAVLGENWYTVCRSSDIWGHSMWTIDHAPLGYSSLAAHGHADALSIWLSVDGRPVFVEAGTFIYHSDSTWRNRFRSTAVHNTLSVESQDSSEMAGAFNWSQTRRASSRVRSLNSAEDWTVEAEHDGYLRTLGARHIRSVGRVGNGQFVIEDRLDSEQLLQAQFSLLLAPDIAATPHENGWTLNRDGYPFGTIRYFGTFTHASKRGDPESGQGWVSDCFMSRSPTTQLLINGQLGASRSLRVEISAIAPTALSA